MANPNETSNETNPNERKTLRAFLGIATDVLAFFHKYGQIPVAIAVSLVTGYAIYDLGAHTFMFERLYSIGVSIGVVCLVLVHGGALLSKNSTNDTRAIHGSFFAAWILFAVAFLAAWSDAQYASKHTDSAGLAIHLLPAGIVNLGANMYQIAPAIAMFTSVASIVIPKVMSEPITTGRHQSIRAALSSLLEPLIIILVVATSAQHVLDYGQRFAGVGDLASMSAMLIAEFTFIVSEHYTLKQLKKAEAIGKIDMFDLALWGAVTLFTLFYMWMVNLMYGHMAEIVVVEEAKVGLVAAAELAHKQTANYQWVKDMYSSLPIIFGAMLFAVSALTTYINIDRKLKLKKDGKHSPNPSATYTKETPEEEIGDKAGGGRGDGSGDDKKKRDGDAPRDDKTKTKSPNPNDIGPTLRTCTECGKQFTGSKRAQYCSGKCRQAAHRRHQTHGGA